MLRTVLGNIAKGIAAGVMVSIGCAVYLACSNKTVGAVLFSVALLTICYFSFSLYTGKIGFLLDNHDKNSLLELLLGLLGNILGMIICGLAISYALPALAETAVTACEAKLGQTAMQTFIRGCFCGVLMYVAVRVYRANKSIAGILFAIPVFILSGFEHSIADMGYMVIAGIFSWQTVGFICLVVLGNSVGALILPALAKLWEKKDEPKN